MPIYENLKDACEGAEHATLTATVCVVGSGPAGAVLAVELAAAGVSVIVLEAGSAGPDHRADAVLESVDVSGHADLRYGIARQLGGATNLWAGRVAPMEAIDLERRGWIPHSGWPVTAAEIEPCYRRAAGVLGIPGHAHFAARDPSVARPLASPAVECRVFQWAREPFNAGAHLATAARVTGHLTVVLNARVTELMENDNATSVHSALVAGAGGRNARVRARAFIVAAGGIETPRLLLNSRSVRRCGIGNDHDVVGRYLSTHPKANMGSLILTDRISTLDPLFCDRPLAGGVQRLGLGLAASVQRERRLLNHYVQLLPLLEHRANRLFERIKGGRTIKSPLIDRAPLIRGVLPGVGLLAFEAIGRLGGVQRRAGKFILRAFLDQYPNPDNRVALSDARGADGMPKADIRWRFTDDDRASVLAFFETMDQDIRSRGVGRIEYGPLRATTDWPLTAIHSHFMGTTRMGDDPATSVTTRDARVHGSENLFVAGPSLFPTYGFANPVYSIVALSLRLADHLKETLK